MISYSVSCNYIPIFRTDDTGESAIGFIFKNKNLGLKLACTIKKIAELSAKGSESDPRYSNYLY